MPTLQSKGLWDRVYDIFVRMKRNKPYMFEMAVQSKDDKELIGWIYAFLRTEETRIPEPVDTIPPEGILEAAYNAIKSIATLILSDGVFIKHDT